MEKDFNNRQNKKLTVFACILSVVSIALLVFGFVAVSSNKVILLQSISNLFNKFNYIDEDSKLLTDKLINSSDVGIRSSVEVFSDVVNGNLSIDYLENKKDKKSELDLNVSVNEQKLLGANLNLSNDNLYLFVDDITTKYYYITQEFVSLTSGLTSSDTDEITALLKETVTDYIDNNDIVKKKETVTYNGQNKKVNKLTYKVTNKTLKEIVNKFLDSIKNNKELFNKLASSFNMSKDELNVLFNECRENLNYENEEILFNYHVYYYGFNKIIRYELENPEDNMIVQYKVEDKESISLLESNDDVLYLEFVETKKGYNYSGYIISLEDKIDFSGSLTGNNLTLVIDNNDSDIKLVIDTTDNQKENTSKFDIKIYNIIDKQEELLLEINVDIIYYFGEKIDTNLENSVDINEITEEDMTTIYTNLLNHPLYQLITQLTTNMEISL